MSNDLWKSFDKLLDNNRRTMDEMISGGTAATPTPSVQPPRAAPRAESSSQSGPASAPSARPPTTQAAAPRLARATAPDTESQLSEKFGNGWRFEVTERRREGEQVIVLGKLTLAETGVTQSQFGQARIGAVAGATTSGVANGRPFTFRPKGSTTASPGGDSEAGAYRLAEAQALANCAALV